MDEADARTEGAIFLARAAAILFVAPPILLLIFASKVRVLLFEGVIVSLCCETAVMPLAIVALFTLRRDAAANAGLMTDRANSGHSLAVGVLMLWVAAWVIAVATGMHQLKASGIFDSIAKLSHV
jgi:hypothetical protein